LRQLFKDGLPLQNGARLKSLADSPSKSSGGKGRQSLLLGRTSSTLPSAQADGSAGEEWHPRNAGSTPLSSSKLRGQSLVRLRPNSGH